MCQNPLGSRGLSTPLEPGGHGTTPRGRCSTLRPRLTYDAPNSGWFPYLSHGGRGTLNAHGRCSCPEASDPAIPYDGSNSGCAGEGDPEPTGGCDLVHAAAGLPPSATPVPISRRRHWSYAQRCTDWRTMEPAQELPLFLLSQPAAKGPQSAAAALRPGLKCAQVHVGQHTM
jgi:hypothetical protein